MFMFQGYSLNLFHPLLPPLCPQVWTHELLHRLIIEDIKEKTLIITLASKQDCILQIKQAINNYKKKTRKLQLVTQGICSDFIPTLVYVFYVFSQKMFLNMAY